MIEVHDVATREAYIGESVSSIARRVYGRNVITQAEHSPEFNPEVIRVQILAPSRQNNGNAWHVLATWSCRAEDYNHPADPWDAGWPGDDDEAGR